MLGEVKNLLGSPSQSLIRLYRHEIQLCRNSACSFISGVIQGNANFTLTYMETALESILKEFLKISDSIS